MPSRGCPPAVMNMTAYWRKSVLCALLALQLARRCRMQDSERLFIAGLLRGRGPSFGVVSHRAGTGDSTLVEATHLNQRLAEVEQASIGCDYAEVGAELIHMWKMPAHLAQAVRYRLSPASAPVAGENAAVLCASGFLADDMEAGARPPLSLEAIRHAAGSLHVPEAVIIEAVKDAQDGLQDTAGLIYGPPPSRHDRIPDSLGRA